MTEKVAETTKTATETQNIAEVVKDLDLTKVDVQEVGQKLLNFDYMGFITDYIIPYGVKILLAIAILLIGKMIAKSLSKVLGNLTLKTTKDEMLQSFVKSMSYFLLMLMVVIGSLSQLGVDTTSLVALIGAAGLAIGLSLQNSLQNFAAGVMILIFKPFFKGDFIEAAGTSGTVLKISLFTLELKTGDNKIIIVPNGKIYADKIVNFSKMPERRVDLNIDVAYTADLKTAKETILEVLKTHNKAIQSKDLMVVVSELKESSVGLIVRYWVKNADFWTSKFEVVEEIKLALDKANVEIPYNKLDVYIKENNSK